MYFKLPKIQLKVFWKTKLGEICLLFLSLLIASQYTGSCRTSIDRPQQRCCWLCFVLMRTSHSYIHQKESLSLRITKFYLTIKGFHHWSYIKISRRYLQVPLVILKTSCSYYSHQRDNRAKTGNFIWHCICPKKSERFLLCCRFLCLSILWKKLNTKQFIC